MRVREAVEQFLDHLESEHRSPHTVAAYRRDLGAFCREAGDTVITSVTPALLTAFMATQSVQVRPCGTPRAKASINRYRVSLKALFAWCSDRWLITRNPTSILKCRRHRSLPPDVLNEWEIARVAGVPLAGRWAERDRTLILFMLATGCRLGETVALNVRDIDFDGCRVTLRSPKGGEPEQLITSEQICGRIRSLAGGTDVTQPIFRTGSGNRLSCRQVQRIVARRCQEAWITKAVTPHTLRHTFATRLYNSTRDIRLVQVALRHEFLSTTERYAHVDPMRLQQAVGIGQTRAETP